MCKYSKSKLNNVLEKITKRMNRRQDRFVANNPIMGKVSIDFVFLTRLELSVTYFCKQALIQHYPDSSPQNKEEVYISQSKVSNKLAVDDGSNTTYKDSNIIDITRIKK